MTRDRAAGSPGDRHRGRRGRPFRRRLHRGPAGRSARPRAVVLIETLRAVDRLRADRRRRGCGVRRGADGGGPAALRAHAGAESVAPPSTVLLLVEPMPIAAAGVVGVPRAGEHPGGAQCRSPRPSQELLDREVPDPPADRAAPGRRRRLRPSPATCVQDPRFRLLPIVFIGSATPCRSAIEALRAGADDFLSDPARPRAAAPDRDQSARSAAAASGRCCSATSSPACSITATLLAELEYAVDYGRRHGGPLAFLVFDLDRFSEVNERFGQIVGDQVLLPRRQRVPLQRPRERRDRPLRRRRSSRMILRGAGAEGAGGGRHEAPPGTRRAVPPPRRRGSSSRCT